MINYGSLNRPKAQIFYIKYYFCKVPVNTNNAPKLVTEFDAKIASLTSHPALSLKIACTKSFNITFQFIKVNNHSLCFFELIKFNFMLVAFKFFIL